jgi:uncharacterized membrane protein
MSEKRQKPSMDRRVRVAVAAIYVLAIAAWAGGLVVLGAIVAPTVFRIVPAPSSADAMTVVFRKFDAVAMTSAAIALVAEATLFLKDGRANRLDLVRGGAAVIAAILAITVGAWLSPGISELHRNGAIRGLNDLGIELERLHRLAEAAGKGQLALLLVVLVLLLAKVARSNSP